MHVVVTGSAGHIGRAVCRELALAGHTVRGVDQAFSPDLSEVSGVTQVVAELLDRSRVYDAVTGADAVVHLGNHPSEWSTQVHRVLPENTAMNSNVFEAAVKTGVRKIVFASSVQAMSGGRRLNDETIRRSAVPSLPLNQDTPANPTNSYGLSKIAGEMLLKLHVRDTPGLAAVAVRFPATGRGPLTAKRRFSPEKLRTDRWGRHIFVDEGFSWLDMADAADLVRVLVERMEPGYDCILPASPDNLADLPAHEIAETYFPGTPVVGDLTGRRTVIDCSALEAKYGWTPRPIPQDRPVEAPA